MSFLDSVVGVTITRATVFPSRAGFGIPLLLAYHTRTSNMTDEYSSTTAMLDDDFEITDNAYKMVAAAFSQNPRPPKVVLGRRLHATTLIVKLTPINVAVGFVYSFDYVAPDGTVSPISYPVVEDDTPVEVGEGLQALLDPLGGSAATVDGFGVVTITASDAGAFFDLKNLPALDDLEVENTSTDANIVDDYNAVKAVDGSTWYGVTIDSNAPSEIEALAAQIETEHKLFLFECSDSKCEDNEEDEDLFSNLKDAAYARTGGLFAQRQLFSYRAVAMLSTGLARGAGKPGSNNWAYMTLNGIAVDTKLSEGSVAKLLTKRANVYMVLGGLNVTYSGLVADGEFFDIIHGADWLYARLQERVLGALYNASQSGSKIPYTDAGVAIMVGLVSAQLSEGVKNGFLAPLPAPVVTGPKVSDVDPAERALRNLPDLDFSATLAGAINTVQIGGRLSV